MTQARFDMDLSRFPVVLVRERGTLSDAERADMMNGLGEVLQRRGRHAIVLDLTAGTALPQPQRMFVSDQWHTLNSLIAQKWAGLAVAVRPPLLTGLPVGAFWLKAAPVPAKIFPSVDEALRWARGMVNQSATGEIDLSKVKAADRAPGH